MHSEHSKSEMSSCATVGADAAASCAAVNVPSPPPLEEEEVEVVDFKSGVVSGTASDIESRGGACCACGGDCARCGADGC